MECYRDRTYCKFWEKCKKGLKCDRSATDKVYSDAKAFGAPLCLFIDPPECYKEKK